MGFEWFYALAGSCYNGLKNDGWKSIIDHSLREGKICLYLTYKGNESSPNKGEITFESSVISRLQTSILNLGRNELYHAVLLILLYYPSLLIKSWNAPLH